MTEEADASAKLITVFGTPSGFTRFGVFVLHSLLRVTVKHFDHTAASELEHLRAAWGKRRHKNFLLFSDCPERAIVETYLKTRAPVLLIFEDPKDVAMEMVRERDLEPAWAVRVAEQSLTTLSDLFRSDHALIVPRDRRLSMSDYLVNAAGHFGLPLSDGQLEEVAKAVAPGVKGALGSSLDDLYVLHSSIREPNARNEASFQSMARFEPVFTRLRRLVKAHEISEISWPVFMLIAGGAPNAEFDGGVDLVGPARCLIYGPFMCLPTGNWGLEASISVSGNQSGNEIEIDIYQADALVRNRFALPAEGQLEIRAQFVISEPRIPVQLRLITTEGAIEGRLTVDSVSLVKLDHLSG